ncbi:MAG: phosphate signaling complex protein PhoU [Lautropia sp.]
MDHTYTQFDTDLQRLRSTCTAMAALVQRQILRAVDAVMTEDPGRIAQVLADEVEVNRMHLQTDLLCNQMIAKLQPIAVDLREILAALHMNNDLERIGDEAKKIALKARLLGPRPLPIATDRIARMVDIACEMLRLAVDAYLRQDPLVAGALVTRDWEVDGLRNNLTNELAAVMSATPASVSTALALIFVVQSIERVGDHATNISEYVVTVVDGTDPRHSKSAASV